MVDDQVVAPFPLETQSQHVYQNGRLRRSELLRGKGILSTTPIVSLRAIRRFHLHAIKRSSLILHHENVIPDINLWSCDIPSPPEKFGHYSELTGTSPIQVSSF